MFETFDRFAQLVALRDFLKPLVVLLSVTLASSAHATPLISELLYDAVGSDDGHGFVELAGTPGTILDGMTLEGVNGSNGAIGPVITLSGSIAADGLFVVADTTSSGTTVVPLFDLLANFDFQNGPDSVVLRDSGGAVLDSLGYGVFGGGEVFAGEGAPAPDVAAGSSLARLFADLDSDDNALDFQELATPTPGVADFASVPEPGTAALMTVGLVTLTVLGRRRPVSGSRHS